MAELALAATIFKAAGTAVQLGTGLWKVGTAIGEAGWQVRLVAKDLECTSTALTLLGRTLQAESQRQPDATALAERQLEVSLQILNRSSKLLEELRPLAEIKNKFWLKQRIRWVLKRPKFDIYQKSLESFKSSLNILISSMNYASGTSSLATETSATFKASLERALAEAPEPLSKPPVLLLEAPEQQLAIEDSLPARAIMHEGMDQDERAIHPQISSRHGDDPADKSDTESIPETIDLTIAPSRGSTTLTPGEPDFIEDEPDIASTSDYMHAVAMFAAVKIVERDTVILAKRTIQGQRRFATTAKSPDNLTIGWLCREKDDYIAACSMFDGTASTPIARNEDHNMYTYGSIEGTRVVLVFDTRRAGERPSYVRDLQSVPEPLKSVDLVLVVGTGSALLWNRDREIGLGAGEIRFGDVVFGETVFGLCGEASPPLWARQLLLKMATLESLNQFQPLRDAAEREWPNRKTTMLFKQPPLETDILFDSESDHISGNMCEKCDKSCMTLRDRDDYQIHYADVGVYVREDDVYGPRRKPTLMQSEFIMLADKLPCLVVCGISDYFDSHRNSTWRRFASANAAACARGFIVARGL